VGSRGAEGAAAALINHNNKIIIHKNEKTLLH
jgi:hypothetical protein